MVGNNPAPGNHTERRKRREAIALHVKEHGVPAAQQKFEASADFVYGCLREFGVDDYPTKRVLNKRPKQERDKIAAYAIEHGVDAAMEKFKASYSKVYSACLQRGERPAPKRVAGTKTLRIVALLQAGRSQSSIAEELKCSRQNVHIVKSKAELAGIVFPGGADET